MPTSCNEFYPDHILTMHPVIRIACFLLLVLELTIIKQRVLGSMLLLLLLLWITHCPFSPLFLMLKRLRWLFLSLLVLYVGFDNTSSWLDLSQWLLALERILALVAIVSAAYLLTCTTSTEQLVAALQWWLKPFKRFLFAEKLAVRVALILENVQTVQQLYIHSPSLKSDNMLEQLIDNITNLFLQTLTYAEITPLQSLDIPDLIVPPWWQWSYPILIGIGIWASL